MAEYLIPLGLLILYLVASRKKPPPSPPPRASAPPLPKRVAPPTPVISQPPLPAPLKPRPSTQRSRAAALFHTRSERRRAFLAHEILKSVDHT